MPELILVGYFEAIEASKRRALRRANVAEAQSTRRSRRCVDVDDSSTSGSQDTVRLRTQFVEWFAAANHEDAIENLALCFVDDGYGFLDIDDPRDAAQLLTVLLRNQLEPEAYCTWEIDGENYYLDSGYINPATKNVIRRPLTSIVGIGSRDYANLLFE